MRNQNKLNDLILSSQLSSDESAEFIGILSDIDDVDMTQLLEVLQEDPSMVETIYRNYKEKLEAFETGNQTKLDSILEEEKGLLK